MGKKGKLIVLSGPSGVGKGSICKELLVLNPQLHYSVSATTRAPRQGEKEGVNYYFMSREKFFETVEEGGFLEWAELFGNCYGTPAFAVDKYINAGESVILEIDTQGALQVMKKRPDCVSVFVLPPNKEELEKRIRGRATENEDDIRVRLERSNAEISLAQLYKYTVINDEIQRAICEIEDILRKENVLPKKQK